MDSPGSYYLTEFKNYVSKDGLFRKWRFFYIGGEIVFRSLFIGKSWNLHVRDRGDASSGLDQQETYREERRMLDMLEAGRLTGIVAMLRAVAAMLRLDYFGVDCALTSPETAILFEANATMNFGNLDVATERPHKARIVSSALQATRRLLENSSRISAAPSMESRERSRGQH